MSVKPELIIPYSIWHNIDGPNNQYLSYIEKGISSHKEIYEKLGVGWKKYATFFAFSPNFIPVPLRTKIISIDQRMFFPYDTYNVSIDLDPFSTEITPPGISTLQFLTYVEGVQNARILYFHSLRLGVFASFDIKPPTVNSQRLIKRPLLCFVMERIPLGFECIDGSCQPSFTDRSSNVIDCIYHCKENIHIEQTTKAKEQDIYQSNPLNNLTFTNSTGVATSWTNVIGVVVITVLIIILYYKCTARQESNISSINSVIT